VEVHLSPERQAQLDDYAQRQGKDPAAALDEVLANYLEWELQDYAETADAARNAYDDVKAGRTRPAAEFLEELREKHGLPGLKSRPEPNKTQTQFWSGCCRNMPAKRGCDGLV
jgi:hypothetical protein